MNEKKKINRLPTYIGFLGIYLLLSFLVSRAESVKPLFYLYLFFVIIIIIGFTELGIFLNKSKK